MASLCFSSSVLSRTCSFQAANRWASLSGTVKCWGWNSLGQLGNNTTTNSAVPVSVSGWTADVRAIAITGRSRLAALPQVPTFAEAGLPEFSARNWFGVLAPAATPLAVIDRLHREVSAVQNAPELQKQFDADGATVLRMTPAAFGAYMIEDMNKWERVVKDGGIKAQ